MQTIFLFGAYPIYHKQYSLLLAFGAVTSSASIAEFLNYLSEHIQITLFYNFLTCLQVISPPFLHLPSTFHHLFTLSRIRSQKDFLQFKYA